jgi:hypothetical protein
LAFAVWLAGSLPLGAAGEPSADQMPPVDETETIKDRVLRDILYGADDFFSEDLDLVYTDVIVPSGHGENVSTVVTLGLQAEASASSRRQSGTSAGNSGASTGGGTGGGTGSGGTGGGGTGGGGGGTVEPPPEPPGGGEEPPPI